MSIKNNLIIKAIERNKTEVVKQSLNLLKKLSNSFDIGQIRDKKGNTVLHYAVRNSNHELAQLFINKYKIDINLRNQHKQTPLTFAIGNFVTGVGGEENLSAVERLNRRFSRGDNLMIIDLLLRSGAKFDMAEYVYLLSIIENQKNKNEYLPLCERIEETLSSILDKKQEKGYENLDYTGHIHNIPEYGNSSQYGILGYDNIDDYTSEHIYEEIDELRDNKEELSSNIHMNRSSSVSSINSDNTWSSWDNDESKCQTLSNPQSDDEERSRTPESGYRSGDDTDQQKSKIAALPSYQSNIGKPLISPKPANSKENYVKNMAKMFENKTSSSLNGRYNSGFKFDGPSSKVLPGSIKKVLNRSNFLLDTLPSR